MNGMGGKIGEYGLEKSPSGKTASDTERENSKGGILIEKRVGGRGRWKDCGNTSSMKTLALPLRH